MKTKISLAFACQLSWF